MASVATQTAVAQIEHVIVPDYLRQGVVVGLYGRIPWYAGALRGAYVHVLADDDVLAGRDVVARLREAVDRLGHPPAIVVRVEKNGMAYPKDAVTEPPVRGRVDMASYVLRRDVWRQFASAYGERYAGDFDHALAMWEAGIRPVGVDLLWARGPKSKGRAVA